MLIGSTPTSRPCGLAATISAAEGVRSVPPLPGMWRSVIQSSPFSIRAYSGRIEHVFLGDIIYNHTHCYFRDGHALKWCEALDRLLDEYDHTAVFHPAHGEDCGTEMIYWQKAYIEAFLGTLTSLLGTSDKLDDAGKQVLVGRMKSFLPNEKLLPLMLYELDETIALLRHSGSA